MRQKIHFSGTSLLPTRRATLGGLAAGVVTVTTGALVSPARAERKKVIGLVPKFTSDPYFTAANQGGQQAGNELGYAVEYNGPVNADVAAQADIIDRMVRSRVSALCVCANDPNALAPALIRARHQGVKVMTWDADVRADARRVFLNQATIGAIGETIADIMAKDAGTSGDFLLITGSLTATNMLAWTAQVKKVLAAKHPQMQIKAVLDGNEDIETSKNVTVNYLRSHPETKGVFSMDGIASIGIAEAVQQLGLQGKVAIAGIGVPSSIRPYIKDGTIRASVLWDPVHIGYGAIYIAHAQLNGTLNPASGYVSAGKLGKLKFVSDDVVLLGPPLVFTKDNIDQYHF